MTPAEIRLECLKLASIGRANWALGGLLKQAENLRDWVWADGKRGVEIRLSCMRLAIERARTSENREVDAIANDILSWVKDEGQRPTRTRKAAKPSGNLATAGSD